MKRRGFPSQGQRQDWLDEFRYEYNCVRPHEALEMKTPASVWRKSVRAYQAQPRSWEYEAGAEVQKVAAGGYLHIGGRRWEISRALAGEWVQLIRVGQRILVYYCRSLVRELDPLNQRSTAVDRWLPSPGAADGDCKGCPDNTL